MSELAAKAIQEQLFRHLTRFEIGALRTLLELTDHSSPTTLRRDEAIFYLIDQLSSKASLRKVWEKLDPVTQKAVGLTVHLTGGVYQPDTVQLRYGQVPPAPQRYWSGYKPTALDLFLNEDQTILNELLPLLRVVAPKPEPWKIPTQPEPPPRYEAIGFERSVDAAIGLQDLMMTLGLIGQQRILVNDRLAPTFDSIQLILENLQTGDFYERLPDQDLSETIRPFGLARFALGSGMAELGVQVGHNHTLRLKPLGWEWLTRPSADLLLDALESWMHFNQFDELWRLPHLRNAARRESKRTPPGDRRDRIVEALSWCPEGEWLSIDDFFTAIKLWQFSFEVDLEGDLNAIDDSGGRKLDTSALRDPWRAVQGAYTLNVLWETLASLGALDLAYTEPQHAPPLLDTPSENWQRPMQPYSRYDGLKYFRINALGAYLFGHRNRYSLPEICTAPFLHIDETLALQLAATPPAYQRQILPLISVQDEQKGWRLNKAAWLQAQQSEGTLREQRELLTTRHVGPLSPQVEDWLDQAEADAKALRRGRTMIAIQVRNNEVRNTILEDPELRRYARLLDERTLIIPSSREHAFMRRALELGYGMVGGPANS